MGEMEKGDIVMVYEDPFTKKKEEGLAKLLKLETSGSHSIDRPLSEDWKVRFVSDGFVTYRKLSTA